MAFARVDENYVNAMITYLEAAIAANESALEVWKANRAMLWLGKDVYVNRRKQTIIAEKDEIPEIVKAPCRFATREEIEPLYLDAQIQMEIYKMFLDAIDNGDFLMVDDDPDERGYPGYQLFRKDNPSVDVLKIQR